MVGALFCSDCGESLLETEEPLLFVPNGSDHDPEEAIEALAGPEEDSVPVAERERMTFVIPSTGRRVTMEIDDEIRVGRSDPRHEVQPELDLTQDFGALFGVSRLHASVQASGQGIVLVDLDSTNGTILNNHSLPPNIPYPLQDGDEIHLGRLLVHVFIEV